MKREWYLWGFMIIAAAVLLMGCAGEKGPQGPQGPEGPAGPPGSEGGALAFLGNDSVSCGHCHAQFVGEWHGTQHANAWATLGADTARIYCVQCHVTGFDSRYDPNGNLVSTGPDTTGYDNDPRPDLRNVQCEACHGPMGPVPAQHVPQIAAAMNGTTCGDCHPSYAEWATSGHGTAIERAGGEEAFLAEWGSQPCMSCHVGEGFILRTDPDYAGGGLAPANEITCATCHDPHDATNDSQLRTLAPAQSPYSALSPSGYLIEGFGTGQVCVQCHHARRTEANILSQINNGNAHPGPHPSDQGDMLSGQGSYELPGFTYNRATQHPPTLLPNECADCHMVQHGSFTDADTSLPFTGHTFRPELSYCQNCHPGATSFDVNGIQTEVHSLLSQLAMLLPPVGVDSVAEAMDTLTWTRPQREAGYIYHFVNDDASYGVHNRDYTISLLNSAIQYLGGGSPN